MSFKGGNNNFGNSSYVLDCYFDDQDAIDEQLEILIFLIKFSVVPLHYFSKQIFINCINEKRIVMHEGSGEFIVREVNNVSEILFNPPVVEAINAKHK